MEALIVAICLVNTQLACQIQLNKPVTPQVCAQDKAEALRRGDIEMKNQPGLVVMARCMKAGEEPT